MEDYQYRDSAMIVEAFKKYGGINITISQAYRLWKNHSARYCASWTGGGYMDLKTLYEMLNEEWCQDNFYSLFNRCE